MFETKNKEDKKIKDTKIQDIAATIAHEIKNPLSLVAANIDLLEKADKDKIYESNYNIIKKEINKINDMMIDFINLTKEKEGEKDIVYLYDIIENLIFSYKTSLDNNIDFVFECTECDVIIIGNENELTRAISNLMKNAIESIGNNAKGLLIIKLYANKDNVFLDIIDNGIGISDYHIERVVNKSFTTKTYGTGLGLAIVDKIIKEHDAKFVIKNNQDNYGCICTIKFPNAENLFF